MSLDRIAQITISLQASPLALANFGVPMLAVLLTAPQSTAWDTEYGASVDTAEVTPGTWQTVMSSLGITSSEDAYIALEDLFSQDRKPPLVLLGRRATAQAQVDQVDIDGTTDGTFTVTINGNDYAFAASGDTATAIRDGLIAAITGGTDPVTAAIVDADSLSVTANEAGVPFTISVDHSTTPADISTTNTTPNVGINDDIATWRGERDDWYFLLETTRSSGVIQTAATTIEALGVDKYFVAQTDDANAQTASTADLASVLGATGLNLSRTAVWWNDNDDEFIDAAAVGKMAPADPGAETWANQSLSGVSGITPTSEVQLANKRYNWLEVFTAANFSMTQGGWSVNGTFTDLIRFRDWLKNLIQVRLVQALRDAPKIPYTDEGGEIIGAVIRGALEQGADQGGVVRDSIVVVVPLVADQDPSDRADRHFPDVTFAATLQGAVHTLEVTGSLAP